MLDEGESGQAARPKSGLLGYEVEILLLLVLFGSFTWWIVPSRLIMLHLDGDFTAWVANIANQLDGDKRLYDDGFHSPMPPIPFVFLRLVSGGEAVWLTENAWFYGFQCATLAAVYIGLSLVLPRPVPWLAVFSTFPIFIGTGKSILYDPMAQFCVAVMVAAGAWLLRAWVTHEQGDAANTTTLRTRASGIVVMGIASAFLLLTKQSTAAGAIPGCVLFLALAQAQGDLRSRVYGLLIYGASLLVAFGLLLLALLPWVSITGLINDVYVTGSEPKGGSQLFSVTIPSYVTDLRGMMKGSAEALFVAIPLIILIVPGLAPPIGRSISAGFEEQAVSAARALPWAFVLLLAAILAVPVFVLLNLAEAGSALDAMITDTFQIRMRFMHTGLIALLIVTILTLILRPWARARHLVLCDLFLVAFPACLGHSLSRGGLRINWWYDNNPLISLVLAAIFMTGLRTVYNAVAWRPALRSAVALVFTFLIALSCWAWFDSKLDQVRICTESTDRISYLKGARFRPEFAHLFNMAHGVQWAAGRDGTVLVLPNDPDLEAIIGHPRPNLTSAIVFVDQYWDRYVDEDFRRLEAEPPNIILIGPQIITMNQRFWGHEDGSGAARLIDLVLNKLIPGRYTHAMSFMIPRRIGEPERMDLYKLKSVSN